MRHCLSTLNATVDNLPFPVHKSLWNAKSASDWAAVAEQQPDTPRAIHEVLQRQTEERYDVFQSAVLIAASHDQCSGLASDLHANFEHVLDQSSTTQIQLLTAKLSRLVPMRALLAISGETWVLGTKLTSREECSSLKAALSGWIDQIWSSTIEHDVNPAAEALNVSLAIINCSLDLETANPVTLGLSNELGLFFAALVLWAATTAASSRFTVSKVSSQHLQAPFLDHDVTGMSHSANRPNIAKLVHQPPAVQQPTFSTRSERRLSIPWVEIFSNTSLFLSTAITDISTHNIAACQTGCTSVLLWTKMHLRGAFSNVSDSAEIDPSPTGHYRGEIINEAISQIERVLDRDWESWGI